MNRQAIIKLLQSSLSDEDVIQILKDIVCTDIVCTDVDAYRPTYQPYQDFDKVFYGSKYIATCNVSDEAR